MRDGRAARGRIGGRCGSDGVGELGGLGGRGRLGAAAGALGAVATLLAGCATRQAVPLDCVTEEVVVYVDGRLLAENPGLLELSTDEPHKLYFKRPGFEPQLVVLDPSVDADGRESLEPRDVCAELRPIGLDRELTIEAEDEAPN
jgi:hypothetical protein